MITTAAHMSRARRLTDTWYVCFSGSGSVTLSGPDNVTGEFEYSYDNGVTWQDLPTNQSMEVSAPLCVKTIKPRRALQTMDGGYQFVIGEISEVSVSGELYSLLFPNRGECEQPVAYAFQQLFLNCKGLRDAQGLNLNGTYDLGRTDSSGHLVPDFDVPEYGMHGMFRRCTNLTTPPPAILSRVLGTAACYDMFYGCSSLENAPRIESDVVGDSSCSRMFRNCPAMREGPPRLRAKTLGPYSYESMFYGCTSLERAPQLMFDTVDTYSCFSMFQGTSIGSVTLLPKVIPVRSCAYESMFLNCSQLSSITTAQTSFDGCDGWVYNVAPVGEFRCNVTELQRGYPNMDTTTNSVYPISMGDSYAPSMWTQSPLPSPFPPLDYEDPEANAAAGAEG